MENEVNKQQVDESVTKQYIDELTKHNNNQVGESALMEKMDRVIELLEYISSNIIDVEEAVVGMGE